MGHNSGVTIPAGTLVPRDARDFGSYQLLAKLATGGMAEIYLARPSSAAGHQSVLVLKRILPHLAEDEHFVTMFRDEADLASKLIHKNVCHVSSFGSYAGTWFIAMEYLHGVPLSRMMTRLSKSGKLLDYRVVAAIICQACEGLHAAHEARGPDEQLLGVVHRDVSPPNIMVTSDGTVKLLDFGIAKARGANSRTRTGTVKGKNAYMSPEQILGKSLDRRSDVFALAVVMYEMLAIKRLFHRDSDFLTFKAITEEPIPDIRDRRPDVPSSMRAAMLQAMARDPAGRFDTALAFGNAIRNAVTSIGGPATQQELARLLFTDFSDEMAQRDEILRAADDPNAAPISLAATQIPATPAAVPIRPAPVQGELPQGQGQRSQRPTGPIEGVPSMIVHQGSSKVALPPALLPQGDAALAGVLDLSANMPVDTWMADGGTNLLSAHRWKSLRNAIIAIAILAGIAVAIVVVVSSSGGASDDSSHVVASHTDAAAPIDAAVKIDADNRANIEAEARFGYFSITANAKTSIFIDGRPYGETPMTRYPLPPGPHVVRLVGPKKSKTIKITMYGGKDTDEGTVNW